MTENRTLNWEGLANVRDLGGLKTGGGRVIRPGAVIRADHPSRLTAGGWEALHEYGIRTVIRLGTIGNPNEEFPDSAPRPAGLTSLRIDIEDIENYPDYRQKWAASELWSTPLYYPDALTNWPDLHAEAIKAIAHARPGGVCFHCVRGVDRTGLIAILLLALLGVSDEDILADYKMSLDPEREVLLAVEGTNTRDVIMDVLESLDAEAYLKEGGLTGEDIDALRARVLEAPDSA